MMNQEPIDPSLPARLREFHERLPLAGDPPNGLLSLPDDPLLYLAAILRDTPVAAPALSPEAWQGFLDLLRPHGVYPLFAYRLRAWPEDCRPLLEIMEWLDRVFLFAAERSMRAGRQIQAVVDALEAAGEPEDARGLRGQNPDLLIAIAAEVRRLRDGARAGLPLQEATG